jgi:hypothetical protein
MGEEDGIARADEEIITVVALRMKMAEEIL